MKKTKRIFSCVLSFFVLMELLSVVASARENDKNPAVSPFQHRQEPFYGMFRLADEKEMGKKAAHIGLWNDGICGTIKKADVDRYSQKTEECSFGNIYREVQTLEDEKYYLIAGADSSCFLKRVWENGKFSLSAVRMEQLPDGTVFCADETYVWRCNSGILYSTEGNLGISDMGFLCLVENAMYWSYTEGRLQLDYERGGFPLRKYLRCRGRFELSFDGASQIRIFEKITACDEKNMFSSAKGFQTADSLIPEAVKSAETGKDGPVRNLTQTVCFQGFESVKTASVKKQTAFPVWSIQAEPAGKPDKLAVYLSCTRCTDVWMCDQTDQCCKKRRARYCLKLPPGGG